MRFEISNREKLVGGGEGINDVADGVGGGDEELGFCGVEGRVEDAFDAGGTDDYGEAEADVVDAEVAVDADAEGHGAFGVEEDGFDDGGGGEGDGVAGVAFFAEDFDAALFG